MFEYTGGLAQLGEHLLCKQGVVGSIPSTSTKDIKPKPKAWTKLRAQRAVIKVTRFRFDILNDQKLFVL